MCRVFKLHRSGFYAWLDKPLSNHAIEDQRLLKRIKEFYVASGALTAAPGFTEIFVMRVKSAAFIVWRRLCERTGLEPK